MSYIAFLDLLGTKNLSTDDATSYSKSISIFTNCLQRSLVEGCEAYAFSDCAYLEASTLSQIVSTLYGEYQKARRDMQELVTIKANIDTLMGYTEPGRKQEKER